jgi:hypothetical protein
MAATITIQLVGAASDNGDVRFSELITQLEAIKVALRETEVSLLGSRQRAIDYRVIDVRHNSPSTLELEPIIENIEPEEALRVMKGFTTELRTIRQKSRLITKPEIHRLEAYREIGPHENGKLEEVRIALREKNFKSEAETKATVDKKFKDNLQNILGPDEYTFGAISGRLEYVNLHNTRKFKLYPIVGPRWIRGTFREDLRTEIRAGVDRNVTIFGRLRFKNWDQQPYAVDAQKVDVHEEDNDLPSLNDLKGIAPNLTGGLRSDEWVRRLRDEEW